MTGSNGQPEWSAAPVRLHEDNVRQAWIDYNGHMNVAYYVLVFDRAVDRLWELLGIDDAYRDATGCSTFAVESHLTYQRELSPGESMRVDMQLLGFDRKRVHAFYRMMRGSDGRLAATCEWMNLHVDLRSRRVMPLPEGVLRQLAALEAAQAALPRPAEAGRVMRVAAR